MTRREFLAASALLATGFIGGCGFRRLGRSRPRNLVLIISDTLRADHLTCNGFPASITPGIDALVRRGTLFTDVMSPAPLTGAAHASIMTGAYQTVHGVVGNGGEIPARVPTLAKTLQDAGWDTAAFVSNPVLRPSQLAGIERGFAVYDDDLPSMERNRPSPYRDARATTDSALRWLQNRTSGRLFLWAHYMEPHGPYEVPDDELLARLDELGSVPGEPDSLKVLSGNYGRKGIPKYQVMGDERQPLSYRRRYAARVAYVDGQICRLIRELGQQGLGYDTLLVFTSDHGELLGEHDYYFQHGITVLQPVLKVPLLLVGPGVPAGGRNATPANLVDVMPTALSLLDNEFDGYAEQSGGVSLQPAMEGKTPDEGVPHYAFCQRTKESCIRLGRWKYTLRQQGKPPIGVLNDLTRDPEEKEDLSSQAPEAASDLRGRLEELMAQAPDLLSKRKKSMPAMSSEDRERLKALGYLK